MNATVTGATATGTVLETAGTAIVTAPATGGVSATVTMIVIVIAIATATAAAVAATTCTARTTRQPHGGVGGGAAGGVTAVLVVRLRLLLDPDLEVRLPVLGVEARPAVERETEAVRRTQSRLLLVGP